MTNNNTKLSEDLSHFPFAHLDSNDFMDGNRPETLQRQCRVDIFNWYNHVDISEYDTVVLMILIPTLIIKQIYSFKKHITSPKIGLKMRIVIGRSQVLIYPYST